MSLLEFAARKDRTFYFESCLLRLHPGKGSGKCAAASPHCRTRTDMQRQRGQSLVALVVAVVLTVHTGAEGA